MLITKQLVPIDFHGMKTNTMEVNGDHQLFGYQHSSKYLLQGAVHTERVFCV